MSEKSENARRTRVQIKFLRDNWPNDGAEGETIHAVCDALEKLLDDANPSHDTDCDSCGGLRIGLDGGRCYECGGSGKQATASALARSTE